MYLGAVVVCANDPPVHGVFVDVEECVVGLVNLFSKGAVQSLDDEGELVIVLFTGAGDEFRTENVGDE